MPVAPDTPKALPTIGVALGGGGARGLAHIAMLEVFDELGVKPSIISGTSIGAIFGAAYASGMTGRELRAHTRDVLKQRLGLVRDLFAARSQPFQRLRNPFAARSSILDPLALLDLVLPKSIKATFEELPIPLKIVASDFYEQEAVIFSSGPLRPAVAASMALPVIFQPVMENGRVLIDGGLTNPLPFDLIMQEAMLTVAIDVTGVPVPDPRRASPTAFESLFASAFLFENSIIKEKLRASKPDILISSGTSQYQVLDFLKFDEILAAAEPAKERLKVQLARMLEFETLPQIETPDEPAPQVIEMDQTVAAPKRRRGILKRRVKSLESD